MNLVSHNPATLLLVFLIQIGIAIGDDLNQEMEDVDKLEDGPYIHLPQPGDPTDILHDRDAVYTIRPKMSVIRPPQTENQHHPRDIELFPDATDSPLNHQIENRPINMYHTPTESPLPTNSNNNRPVDMYHTPMDSLKCNNPLQDGSPYFEDNADCNCYYVCSKQRNAIKMCCPSGLWWDQSARRCLFGREFTLRKQARCLQLARRKGKMFKVYLLYLCHKTSQKMLKKKKKTEI